MSSTLNTVSAINWSKVFKNHTDDVADFASGILNFREFKRSVKDTEARREISKLEKHEAQNRRVLARRACNRRHVSVNSL